MRRFLTDLSMIAAIAVVVGIGSALIVLEQSRNRGVIVLGPWTATPGTGTAEGDPYGAAVAATIPDLPLGTAEGIAFRADRDSEGRPLSGDCSYRVEGRTPVARLWTITAYDANTRLFDTTLGRVSFHSREILRAADGSFTIAVAAEAKPGNWLPIAGEDAFSLALRLYDTPLTTALAAAGQLMPAIVREGCR